MILGVIEVEFGPHWADMQLVGLTGLSILMTTVLGLIAWLNGAKATAIAQQANQREEKRIEAERAAKIDDARKETALSMVQAVIAYKTLGYTPTRSWTGGQSPGENPRLSTARQDAELVQAKALAQISLFSSGPESARMREWLDHATSHVYYAYQSDEENQDSVVDVFLSAISNWGSGLTTTSQLVAEDTAGPVYVGEGSPWCNGRTFG